MIKKHYAWKFQKVQLFWEGHKNVYIYCFEIYLENLKTMRVIAQIFVVFSEKLNFIGQQSYVL